MSSFEFELLKEMIAFTCIPLGDVLATVLALYMHDKQQPLPSHEEVLICTSETSAEEVAFNKSSCP